MVWLRTLLRALVFPAWVILAMNLPESFFPNFNLFILFPVGAIALLIWAIIHFVQGATAAWRREWLPAAADLLSIMIVIIALQPATRSVIWVSRYAHLATFIAWNAASTIAPEKREGPAEIFDWGGQGLAAGASESRYLVRDASGKTQKDIGEKPDPNYLGAIVETRHLIGSYYLRTLYIP